MHSGSHHFVPPDAPARAAKFHVALLTMLQVDNELIEHAAAIFGEDGNSGEDLESRMVALSGDDLFRHIWKDNEGKSSG